MIYGADRNNMGGRDKAKAVAERKLCNSGCKVYYAEVKQVWEIITRTSPMQQLGAGSSVFTRTETLHRLSLSLRLNQSTESAGAHRGENAHPR